MQTLNQKGVAHPFLALVMALFVLVGAWYVYKSYEQKQIKENLSQVCSDYRTRALTVVNDNRDRERVEILFKEIKSIVSKYQAGTDAVSTYIDKRK